jgi:hypothetical protein
MNAALYRRSLFPALASILAASLLLAAPAGAQMYKWTDEKGRVNYTSTPPPGKIKADPIQLRGVESYQAGPVQPMTPSAASSNAPSDSGAAAAAPAAPGAITPTTEAAATNPDCADGRTNCSRGEAPEFDFPERTNERVRKQFTIDVRPSIKR